MQRHPNPMPGARPWTVRVAVVLALLGSGVVSSTALAETPDPVGPASLALDVEPSGPQTTSLSDSPETTGSTSTAPSLPTTWPTALRAVIGADRVPATGDGVDVALIDSGVSAVPGLDSTGTVLRGPDLSFEADEPGLRGLDTLGHGTHMAGIIAGPEGVAPGARLVSVKVGAANGAVDVSQVLGAIDWVVEHRRDNGLNIRVLNLSVGFDTAQPALVDPLAYAVDRAWRAGIVVVAAGGNDGRGDRRLSSPATNPNIIAVGAADTHGSSARADVTVADFSAYGSAQRRPDLVAPGARVASLRVPGSALDVSYPAARLDLTHFRGSGTSQAAAVVSGSVALLLERRPDLTPAQVKALLKGSASPLPGSTRVGGAGLIDVARSAASPAPTSTPSLVPLLGTGSLELARGLQHVTRNDVVLSGERDVLGRDFNPVAWRYAQLTGGTWSGGTWSGGTWSGGTWSGGTWSGSTWSGSTWSGSTWSGSTWSGSTWSGLGWYGVHWG